MNNSGARWRRLFAQEPRAEVEDELRFHVERRVQDYIARGMDEQSARAAALARIGDLKSLQEECTDLLVSERRAGRRRDWLGDLTQDIRFGLRSALRVPSFTVLAILTLALGIGANAAVFGVVKSVLLDSLPYADSGRLVRVYGRLTDGSLDRSSLSAGTFSDFTERQRSFQRLAAFYHSTFDVTYLGESNAAVLTGALVAGGFFETLGVKAVAGRTLTAADADNNAFVLVLSYDAWQRVFGGSPDIVGKSIRIDSDSYEVAGVLPRGFVGPMGKADLFLALGLKSTLQNPVRARKQQWLGVIGRLRPGVDVRSAQQDLAAIAADLAREHPDANAGMTVETYSLRDAMAGDTRTPLLVLMASAGFVLLITCANLAGAMLSRTISRRKEFAVRVALGAGRGRLLRQLLTESSLLALAGGLAGLLLAAAALALLRRFAQTALPPYADLSLDRGAVLVTALVSLITGVVFGIMPALSTRQASAQGTLRDETRGSSESLRSRRLRGTLVAVQIAISLSLLAGAGLLARSLWAMMTAPAGYDADHVLAVTVKGPVGVRDAARRQFFDEVQSRMRALPGVTSVAHVSELPLPSMNRNGLTIQGVSWPNGEGQPFIIFSSVSDEYFSTMRIPLRSGRTFSAVDRMDTPGAIVISEGMAKRYWPNGDALGARIRLGPDSNAEWSQIVGIVGDVRNDPARPQPEPMAYGTIRQDNLRRPGIFVIRSTVDPLDLVRPIERELAAINRNAPMSSARTLQDLLAEEFAGRRLAVLLMSVFGALALVLASVGVYALFSSMAAAREREFSVRVALGSSTRALALLVLRQGGVWMALGFAGGILGVLVVTRMLRNLLYGVSQFDPVALSAAAAVLLGCGIIALLAPVRRVTRVEANSILR